MMNLPSVDAVQNEAREGLSRLKQFVWDFDGLYDTQQAYKLVLPLMESTLGQLSDKELVPQRLPHSDLALLVGACWCNIVYSDVTHCLQDGMHWIQKSQEFADCLFEQLHILPEGENTFARYVSARWHDGAGKLCYRWGDHTQGRVWIARAVELSEDPRIRRRCYFDIWSNQTRNRYEEKRQAGNESAAAESNQQIQQHIDEAHELLPNQLREIVKKEGYSKNFADRVAKSVPEVRELLRGICSLYHNWSTLPTDSIPNRIARSKYSESVARSLQDGYRLGQALHQQASLQHSENPQLAELLWRQIIEQGKWIRGRFFAEQNILGRTLPAEYDSVSLREKCNKLASDFDGLIQLADEIQRRQDMNRSLPGVLDIDLYGWTVRFANDRFDALRKSIRPGELLPDGRDPAQLESRLLQEIEQMVHSYRRVVKVATYKHAYAKHYSWAYNLLITRALEARDSHRALFWLEESTSRDVLDMVSSQATLATSSDDHDYDAAIASPISTSSKELGDDEDGNTEVWSAASSLRMTTDTQSTLEPILEQILGSIDEFERHAVSNPIQPAPVSKDIFSQVIRFTERFTKLVVVRFVGVTKQNKKDESGKSRPALISSAFVFHRGESHIVRDIDLTNSLEGLKQALGSDRNTIGSNCETLARAIGHDILCPLFGALPKGLPDNALICFIPTAEVLRLPLHIGVLEEEPLSLTHQTLYCGSVSALIARNRIQGCWVDRAHYENPSLGAVVTRNENNTFFGDEALVDEELTEHFQNKRFFIGDENFDGRGAARIGESAVEKMGELLAKSPTFLTIGAHGGYLNVGEENKVHPYLKLRFQPECVVTPYHLACMPRMDSNALVIMAACLIAQGSDLEGGEISGFYRSLVALGAPAIVMPFVPIVNYDGRAFVKMLLNQIVESNQPVFLPAVIRQVLNDYCSKKTLQSRLLFSSFGLFV